MCKREGEGEGQGGEKQDRDGSRRTVTGFRRSILITAFMTVRMRSFSLNSSDKSAAPLSSILMWWSTSEMMLAQTSRYLFWCEISCSRISTNFSSRRPLGSVTTTRPTTRYKQTEVLCAVWFSHRAHRCIWREGWWRSRVCRWVVGLVDGPLEWVSVRGDERTPFCPAPGSQWCLGSQTAGTSKWRPKTWSHDHCYCWLGFPSHKSDRWAISSHNATQDR